MEWKDLHAPSVDKNLKEINYKEFREGMRKTLYGKWAVETNEEFSGLDNPKNAWFVNNLSRVQLLMTASCNLECSYCYSQHRKDFGKWTPELMWKVVEFLGHSNDFKKCLTLVGRWTITREKSYIWIFRKVS